MLSKNGIKRLSLCSALALTSAPLSTHAETKLTTLARPAIEIVETKLLATMQSSDSQPVVTETNRIPYVVGSSCYNWMIRFKPVAGPVVFEEELQLPAAASNWGLNPDEPSVVNPEKSGAVTAREFAGEEGLAIAGWCVAKDDPVGPYRFLIRYNGREIHRFDFIVGNLI